MSIDLYQPTRSKLVLFNAGVWTVFSAGIRDLKFNFDSSRKIDREPTQLNQTKCPSKGRVEIISLKEKRLQKVNPDINRMILNWGYMKNIYIYIYFYEKII